MILNMEINKITCGNREILRFALKHVLFFTIKVYLDSVLSDVSGYRKLPNSAKDYLPKCLSRIQKL